MSIIDIVHEGTTQLKHRSTAEERGWCVSERARGRCFLFARPSVVENFQLELTKVLHAQTNYRCILEAHKLMTGSLIVYSNAQVTYLLPPLLLTYTNMCTVLVNDYITSEGHPTICIHHEMRSSAANTTQQPPPTNKTTNNALLTSGYPSRWSTSPRPSRTKPLVAAYPGPATPTSRSPEGAPSPPTSQRSAKGLESAPPPAPDAPALAAAVFVPMLAVPAPALVREIAARSPVHFHSSPR